MQAAGIRDKEVTADRQQFHSLLDYWNVFNNKKNSPLLTNFGKEKHSMRKWETIKGLKKAN